MQQTQLTPAASIRTQEGPPVKWPMGQADQVLITAPPKTPHPVHMLRLSQQSDLLTGHSRCLRRHTRFQQHTPMTRHSLAHGICIHDLMFQLSLMFNTHAGIQSGSGCLALTRVDRSVATTSRIHTGRLDLTNVVHNSCRSID